MSIYISGVEMPKEHPLYITLRPDGSVHVWDSYSGEGYGTQSILVPPHGRTIDADALRNIVFEALNDAIADGNSTPWGGALCALIAKNIVDEIDASPTIIPADIKTMYYPQVDGITPTVIKPNKEEQT